MGFHCEYLNIAGGEDDNCGPLPPPPQNARYMKDEKSNLVVRCNDDYYRHGNPYVKCLNATWVLNVKCYSKYLSSSFATIQD